MLNPLKAEFNPICHLLALLGAHHILHISRVRVKVQITLFPFLVKGFSYEIHVALRYTERKLRPVRLTGNISCTVLCDMRCTTELYQ